MGTVSVINAVTDYGADPTGATDSLTAIQNAINASAGGQPVYCPTGRYKLSGPLAPATYAGSGGALKVLHLFGDGNAGVTDIFGSYNYGTTFWYDTPSANTPAFYLGGCRNVQISNINILSTNKTVANSVGLWLWGYNSKVVLDHVTIGGFAEGIRIGTSGQPGANDDFMTFRDCFFLQLGTAVRNYSNASYGLRLIDCTAFVNVGTVYKTTDYAGALMNDIEIQGGWYAMTDALIEYALTTPVPSHGKVWVHGITVESEAPALPKLFTMNTGVTSAQNAVFFEKNIVNTGDETGLYDPSFAMIKYIGSGPFVFDDNKIAVVRFVFNLDMRDGGGYRGGTGSISRNRFTNRYALLYPNALGHGYPRLVEDRNVWHFEASQAQGGGLHPTFVEGQYARYFEGRLEIGQVVPGITVATGSSFPVELLFGNDSINTPSTRYVRTSGTYGTITGVTATVNNGANTATFTGGTAAEKAHVSAGAWIKIGASGPLQVYDVIGNTIYLRNTYTGATQTAQALTYAVPFIQTEYRVCNVAPSTGQQGDIAWNVAAAPGGSPGWVYTSGGWKAMPAVAS